MANLLDAVPIELRPMIPGFIERREKELIELQRLLTDKNFDEVKHIGHRLKGTGGGYGFPKVSEIGRELETAATKSDAVGIAECIHTLRDFTTVLKQNIL
jgi:HPt (histidine-containing phosphotransfer) domain-containing protein